MATYSNNTTIKINSGVQGSASVSGFATANAYTCPANSYAILTWYSSGDSTSWSISINGLTIYTGNSNSLPVQSTLGSGDYVSAQNTVYLGPGQTIQINNQLFGSSRYLAVTGVLFSNTP